MNFSVFHCQQCGRIENADVNASMIIGLKGLYQSTTKKFKREDFESWLKQTIAPKLLSKDNSGSFESEILDNSQ